MQVRSGVCTSTDQRVCYGYSSFVGKGSDYLAIKVAQNFGLIHLIQIQDFMADMPCGGSCFEVDLLVAFDHYWELITG